MLLSTPTTRWPWRSKCSTASEPIKPLLPVTRIVFIWNRPVRIVYLTFLSRASLNPRCRATVVHCGARFVLPDLARFFAQHCVTLLAAKRLGKQFRVGKRTVDTKSWNRVLVAVGHQPRILWAQIGAPHLRPTQKKPLLGSKSIETLWTLAFNRLFISCVRDGESAKIRYAFAENQFAIFVKTRLDFITIELLPNARRALIKILAIFFGPPLAEISLPVELRSGIVESMRDLVADYRTHPAIVNRVIGLRIIKRRLQDSCRKHNFIHRRVVIRVHSRRRHSPFCACMCV